MRDDVRESDRHDDLERDERTRDGDEGPARIATGQTLVEAARPRESRAPHGEQGNPRSEHREPGEVVTGWT